MTLSVFFYVISILSYTYSIVLAIKELFLHTVIFDGWEPYTDQTVAGQAKLFT